MARSVDEISGEIVDAAYKLHTAVGPGLLESAYESLLARSLEKRGLKVERQKLISFDVDGLHERQTARTGPLVETSPHFTL
jgi:iron complex transport system substrate-binding protein